MTESYHIQQSPPKKFCPQCKEEKPLIDFRRARASSDGYQNVCKLCCNVHLRWSKTPRQLPLFILSKMCNVCKTEKPIEQFSPNKGGRDGYRSQCKQCQNEYDRAYQASHRESQRAYARVYDNSPVQVMKRRQQYQDKCIYNPDAVAQGWQKLREWSKAHPLRAQARLVRRRARKKNVTVETVNYESILKRDGYICYICGQDIAPIVKKGPAKLTFDHVIPLQPRFGEPQGVHAASNLRPVHNVCNQRKSNRPLETLTPFDRRGVQ